MAPTGRRRAAALVLTALSCHAFAPPTLPRTRHNALRAKVKTKKKKKTAKGAPGGFGAAPKKTTLTDEEKEARAIRGAVRDATSALEEARDQEGEAQAWLKLGAVLVRGGEFSEAERVFAAGAEKFDDEMLSAAEMTYRGHSLSYHRGKCEEWTNEVDFDEWVVGGPDQIEDHRTVSWLPEEPRAFASKGPLIPKDECDRVIALCEKRAEELGGWQKARHAQAATTDMNVKDVPEILECDLGVPRCCGAFTPSMRLVSISQ